MVLIDKEKENGSSLQGDAVQQQSTIASSSAFSPRPPIPRLFSRSIHTWSLEQQQQLRGQQHQSKVSFVDSAITNRSTTSRCSSNQSCTESEPSNTSASVESSLLNIIHPSTLSSDDDSRNPNSVGTIERNTAVLLVSSPQQQLDSADKEYSFPIMTKDQQQESYDEKKMTDIDDDRNFHEERASYRPRGSIRDVTHSWDMDVPNFPIQEIQRIKNKTNRLRSNRGSEGLIPQQTDSNDANTTTTNSLPGQSVRDRATRSTTPTTNNHSMKNYWNGNGSVSRGSKDGLSDVLGSIPNRTPNHAFSKDDSHSNGSGPFPILSSAAKQAEQLLMQGFHKAREPNPVGVTNNGNISADPDVTVNTSTDNSRSSQNDSEPNLMLHDLCGEAVSTDDIAWRNALSVLASLPELSSVIDPSQLWTPLHICCLGITPPPTYIVRALLYVYPKAAFIPDDGGRLSLHLVAASSADINILQMIVEENPAALYHRDHHGLTPLHLYIRNRSVELTMERIRILLGYTIPDYNNSAPVKRHVLQRRGDHLRMSVQSVDRWISQRKSRPITNIHHNTMVHEQYFDTYPIDVQVSLRQLSQWKHSHPVEDEESVEVQLSQNGPINEDSNDRDILATNATNPAAIPLPNAAQYPIHMVLQRMIIEEAFIPVEPTSIVREKSTKNANNEISDGDDDDDEEMKSSSEPLLQPNYTSSILRLFAASYPEALIKRDKNGCTPLLQVIQIRDSFPSVDIVEILIGKRNATGFEALPPWANNLPTHTLLTQRSPSDQRYLNPAMIAVLETGQLPLHIAAEEAPTDSLLIRTIFECYPAATLVQDGRGRTPLHLSFHNYRRIAPDPSVIEILYTDRVANIVDDYGKIPFDLLLENAQLLPLQKPKESVDVSHSIYRKLISASIIGRARPSTPSQVQNFLPRIRSLPSWLRAEACATKFVQDLIVEELASPWKCAFILLDGLLLIALISVFRLQMKRFVDQLYGDNLLPSWYTFTVYATAVGRFMARILFGYFAMATGEFQRLCLFNVWYWIDSWAMLMSIVTSIFLYGSTSDERLLVLGTATTILLWLSFIGYLSSWWYSMAIFTGGFLKVSKKNRRRQLFNRV
jgi:hypothetical protein